MKKTIICSENRFINGCIKGLDQYYNIIYSNELMSFISNDDKKEIEKIVIDKSKIFEGNLLYSKKEFSVNVVGILAEYRNSLFTIICIDKIIDKLCNVSGFITNEHSSCINKSLIKKCNNKGLPTILIPIGIPDKITNPNVYTSIGISEISHVLSMSEYQGSFYKNSDVIITGHPYFDAYYYIKDSYKKCNNKSIVCGFELDYMYNISSKKYELVKTLLNPDNYFNLIKLAEVNQDEIFIFKLKYGTVIDDRYFYDFGLKNICGSKGDWYSFMPIAKIVIASPTSICLMESIFAGIPVITANIGREVWDFKGAKVLVVDWDIDNINYAIKNLDVVNQNNNEFNNFYFPYNQDGKATERCVSVIRSII